VIIEEGKRKNRVRKEKKKSVEGLREAEIGLMIGEKVMNDRKSGEGRDGAERGKYEAKEY
jgi:hypothetical protein